MSTRLLRTAPGFSSSEQTITKAKKPLTITGKEIEVEGTTENKIPEADLSIPEMVKLTGEQTITGRKNFSTPETAEALTVTRATPAAAAAGKAAGNLVTFTFPAGGEGTNGTGGIGSGWSFTLGAGGKGVRTGAGAFGGKGGSLTNTAGKGGEAVNDGTHNGTGGNGGTYEGLSGEGGKAATASTLSNQGGEGGKLGYVSGTGGAAQNSGTGTAVGGKGGEVLFQAGGGGEGKTTGGGAATSGTGGSVKFIAGTAGAVSEGGTEGKGGSLKFVAGKAVTAANSGLVEFSTGTAETLRLSINGEGLTTVKSGLTVEGALTLPAESITETFIKAEAITAGKLATNSVEEAKIKEGAVTETKIGTNAVVAAKIKAEAVEAGKIKAEAVEESKIKAEAVSEGKIKNEAVAKGKLAKAVQEELLKIAAPTAIGTYTSAKEEEEAKGTFVTLVVEIKAEAVAATVKLVNSAQEISFKWDGVALGIQRVPLQFMVKKAGKWKATAEGAVAKLEISRVTMEP